MNTDLPTSKEPWLVVSLSGIFPGIGQIYAGKALKGWIFIGLALALLISAFWALLSPQGNSILALNLGLLSIGFSIWNLFDAHKSARESNDTDFEQLRRSNKDPWLAAFLSRIIPGIGHIYLRQWVVGAGLIALWIVLLSSSDFFVGLLEIVFGTVVSYHAYISAPTRRESSKKLILIFLSVYLIVLLAFTLLSAATRAFVVEPRYIPASSMEPTLQADDRLLIDKISYRLRKPLRTEIIAFNPPANPVTSDPKTVFVKRIIGMPGDRLSIQDGKVFINGQALSEPYVKEPTNYNLPTKGSNDCVQCFQPEQIVQVSGKPSFTVPPDRYWVMGDNRNNSLDSHIWGFLPAENIVGRGYLRYWPVDNRPRDLRE
ncbi:signal peptidase I [Pseudanabaena sp. PCC 6802]|uniref:signal peptidase I n=1 Tax=Pseudanabaena sp. PCC 6802 TaxID=118173 RepID=UPI000348ED23|nr:signal peptidase I [Pseudanabaena sp. PCC 6802]